MSNVPSLWITNVRLPPRLPPIQEEHSYDGTWTVECSDGVVTDVLRTGDPKQMSPTAEDGQIVDAGGGIMLPSCGELTKGDFNEAMNITAKAKQGFSTNPDDLYQRGVRLIEESVENGVTSIRAHVEVDVIVGFSCLDVAINLKAQYKEICDIQIAVFAQEALFESPSDTKPGHNYAILCQAAKNEGVSVVGSAPYVEPTTEQAKKNIKLIFEASMNSGVLLRHIDFHLDYNLDPAAEPLVYEVIARARMYCATRGNPDVTDVASGGKRRAMGPRAHLTNYGSPRPHITIGHATRLQLFSPAEWRALAAAISDIPITIVGLPQSDMYIQGRVHQGDPLGPPRSTLRVPFIEKEYGIKVAMAVNNVDNAFTPQGTLDPLNSLVSFGVAIFQAVTPREIRSLIEAVTLTSKRAVGPELNTSTVSQTSACEKFDFGMQASQGGDRRHFPENIPADLFPMRGDPADFVILHNNQSLRSVALRPAFERTTIKDGRVVARRRKWCWMAGGSSRGFGEALHTPNADTSSVQMK